METLIEDVASTVDSMTREELELLAARVLRLMVRGNRVVTPLDASMLIHVSVRLEAIVRTAAGCTPARVS